MNPYNNNNNNSFEVARGEGVYFIYFVSISNRKRRTEFDHGFPRALSAFEVPFHRVGSLLRKR